MSKRFLSISKCPQHGLWAISIDDEASGTRLTSPKCCGRWDTVKRFPMDASDLREVVNELESQIEQIEGA